MLETVYAYRDDGPMAGFTRWRPRRVYCTEEREHADQPGTLCVVKFRQGAAGTAALISEVVATKLIEVAGLQTLDPLLVQASVGFSDSCNAKPEIPYQIAAGLHYGTLHRDDVVAGPPLRYDDLARPVDVVGFWVIDTWLANIDREVEGNLLLAATSRGKFHLIAADQSDCFCGSRVFCGDRFEQTMQTRGSSSAVAPLMEVLQRNGGPAAIRNSIRQVRAGVPRITEALDLVPNEWWHEAGVDRRVVHRSLEMRSRRLEEILRPDDWVVPNGGTPIII